MTPGISLTTLDDDDREQFILDLQRAFKYGATEEFGRRDEHFEEGREIISRKTIVECLKTGVVYRIRENGGIVGGVVLKIDEKTCRNHLELLFVAPEAHGKGIGCEAWRIVESLYPETLVWETCTPYFETRNIHFYINKCGFHAVEYFCRFHPDPNEPDLDDGDQNHEENEPNGMFRFEKKMRLDDAE